MTHQPHPLDPLHLPLQGECLIEASAGTGKTFTIAALYLRLLLGINTLDQRTYPVTQLLVVTFTEAATQELRARIRANIHAMRLACLRNQSDNPICQRMLAEIADPLQAAQILTLAEQQMDEAAIFTIHGFCQRMLTLNAFESGMPFNHTILKDDSPLAQLASADFWRRHCYPISAGLAQQISNNFSQPDDLLATVKPYMKTPLPRILPESVAGETLIQRHQQIVDRINCLKIQWLKHTGKIADLITQSDINKKSYKKNHLANWITQIDTWANTPTTSYQLPDALTRFSQSVLAEKTSGDNVPRLPLFSAIDNLLSQHLCLTDILIKQAMQEISTSITQQKRLHGQLSFDDLLTRLDQALQSASGANLAQAIRQQFPVAMIDEFQDTDPLQYRIFRNIWHQQQHCALLLIGDPKQAIYAFRGADIFTYMQARNQISTHYSLNTNWRSSPAMVASINQLFSQLPCPFLFDDIPFFPVSVAPKNQTLYFSLHGATQPAMAFWLLEQPVSAKNYRQQMAQICATQIRDWLNAGTNGDARLHQNGNSRPVQACDITILVRNRLEAAIMRDALDALNIPSVYLSNRDSVFATPEARELLNILHAVLNPEQETSLRRAISASLIGFDAAHIETLCQSENAWDQLVENFVHLQQIWRQNGVMPMLYQFISLFQIAENLLATPGGERQLTDLLHLAELLQQETGKLDSQHALIRWLEQQVFAPNCNLDSQQMRLESDKHLVQIVTIHKAKGLEYSLVWLPFIASYREASQAFYHDPRTLETIWDLTNSKTTCTLAQHERLAEDLRLLYVALTRAIWHCSIGLAPVTTQSERHNSLHHSAPGLLIQQGSEQTPDGLKQCLQKLCQHSGGSMQLIYPPALTSQPWQPPYSTPPQLMARTFSRRSTSHWHVTSYSGLLQHDISTPLELPWLDLDAMTSEPDNTTAVSGTELNIHNFPRGASPGTFLHSLLEQLDFSQPVNPHFIGEQLQLAGFDLHWQPVIINWLNQLLNMPLGTTGMALNQLAAKDKLTELAFCLSVNALVSPQHFNVLTHRYDALSADCPPLEFRQLQGMLKGFIDLVFRWQGRYYLLDYKSNWLGENQQAYTQSAMCQAMRQHRYDLQYQIYSLALHRYLRQRLPGYQYQRHFGGIIYLFLRGATPQGSYGVYHTCPSASLIDGMDQLFTTAKAQP